MLKKPLHIFLILIGLLFTGCASNPIFQPIPLNTNPPVLAQPVFMAIDETAARGYVINSNNGVFWENASLIVLDLTNPTAPAVVNSIFLQNFSGQAVLDTAGKMLYVTNRLSANVADPIDQIFQINVDESSPNFLTFAEFQADANPFGIVSDGTNLYVVNEISLDLLPISNLNIRTQVLFNIMAGGSIVNTFGTREAAFSPSGQFVFVTNQNDRMLILDKAQIPVPDPALSLTSAGSESIDYVLSNTISTRGIASDSNFTYVVEGVPPSLKILTDRNLPLVTGEPQQILISTLAVAQLPLGDNPSEVALDIPNNRAYVTITDDGQVAVFDTNLLSQIALITIPNPDVNQFPDGPEPFGVSVGHFGGVPYIYVLNQTTNNITIINGNTLSVVATFP